jgi:hypothetical protein
MKAAIKDCDPTFEDDTTGRTSYQWMIQFLEAHAH